MHFFYIVRYSCWDNVWRSYTFFYSTVGNSKWNAGPVDESWLSSKLLIMVFSDQYADDQPFVVY